MKKIRLPYTLNNFTFANSKCINSEQTLFDVGAAKLIAVTEDGLTFPAKVLEERVNTKSGVGDFVKIDGKKYSFIEVFSKGDENFNKKYKLFIEYDEYDAGEYVYLKQTCKIAIVKNYNLANNLKGYYACNGELISNDFPARLASDSEITNFNVELQENSYVFNRQTRELEKI